MGDKIKTSIMIDRELWEEFKSKIGSEKGLRMLSKAVEEAIEDEIAERLIIKVLEEMLKEYGEEVPLTISPVKPKVITNAGKIVKEMRESRT